MANKTATQRKYVVTLTKRFEYPACVVNQSDPRTDILRKVAEDFLDASLKNEFQDSEVSISLEPSLKLRPMKDPLPERTQARFFPAAAIADDLAQALLAKELGKGINYDESPELFEKWYFNNDGDRMDEAEAEEYASEMDMKLEELPYDLLLTDEVMTRMDEYRHVIGRSFREFL